MEKTADEIYFKEGFAWCRNCCYAYPEDNGPHDHYCENYPEEYYSRKHWESKQ